MVCENHRPPFITTTSGMRGIFCVMMCWTWIDEEKDEGFYEPWTSSEQTFKDIHEAKRFAIAWANDEGIEVR